MRRGARLLWYSVRAQRRPFALAIVGAAAVLRDGGRRHHRARPGDRRRADAGLRRRRRAPRRRSSAPPPSSPASALRMVGVVLRRYFGQMAQRRMQVLWFTRVTDRYLDVPLPLVRRAPHRRAARPRRRRLRALDDGDAAPPVLARRGAAHRRVDGAARHRRPGAPRRRRRAVPRPGRCSTTPTRSGSSSRPPPPRPASATCRASPTRASRAPCS